MSRPSHNIELSIAMPNGCDQEIQTIDTVWHLTYNGQLAKIRIDTRYNNTGFKYKRNCWATEASGWSAVQKLRNLYNDDGFGLLEITP